jgi:hypothetical protein
MTAAPPPAPPALDSWPAPPPPSDARPGDSEARDAPVTASSSAPAPASPGSAPGSPASLLARRRGASAAAAYAAATLRVELPPRRASLEESVTPSADPPAHVSTRETPRSLSPGAGAGAGAGASTPSAAVLARLRERCRKAETRVARLESELAATSANADAHRRDAEAFAAAIAKSDAALEDQREKTRAAEAEAAAANARADALARERSVVSARLEAQSLSPAARCDALLKAGWLAHYWRLAYELGVAPERSWREAELWSRRAPEGGDEALRRVALAAAEEASASGPALAFLGSRGGGGGGGGGSGSDAAAFAPSHPAIPRPGAAGWDPTTAADAAEVETALRVAAQSRLEEAVLVALADRRRALASRLVGKAAEALTRGSIGSFGSGESRRSRRAAKTPNPDDAPNADGVDDETDDESDDLGDEHMGGERGAGWIRLSPAEEAEVRYRRDWLAYAWSRALASGAEAGTSASRRARWAARARGEQAVFASASEALEVEEGLAEVRDLGVEVQVWRMERGEGE